MDGPPRILNILSAATNANGDLFFIIEKKIYYHPIFMKHAYLFYKAEGFVCLIGRAFLRNYLLELKIYFFVL